MAAISLPLVIASTFVPISDCNYRGPDEVCRVHEQPGVFIDFNDDGNEDQVFYVRKKGGLTVKVGRQKPFNQPGFEFDKSWNPFEEIDGRARHRGANLTGITVFGMATGVDKYRFHFDTTAGQEAYADIHGVYPEYVFCQKMSDVFSTSFLRDVADPGGTDPVSAGTARFKIWTVKEPGQQATLSEPTPFCAYQESPGNAGYYRCIWTPQFPTGMGTWQLTYPEPYTSGVPKVESGCWRTQ